VIQFYSHWTSVADLEVAVEFELLIAVIMKISLF
jgi:hypothetical protein